MKPYRIDPEMTVDEMMRRWPATIRVMIRNRMLCIGCPIGIFHTVRDAAAAHQLDEGALTVELLEAMQTDPQANAPSAFLEERRRPEEEVFISSDGFLQQA